MPSLGLGLGLPRNPFGAGIASFTGLLDLYPGAAAAYSLRALSAGWVAGDVVLVRRSSDSAQLGFTAAEVINGTLTTWTGAGDGFVTTWYDQSGEGNDATQAVTTAQPKIVDTGALVVGGLDFDGTDDVLVSINDQVISQEFTSIHVSNADVTATGIVISQSTDPTTAAEWNDFYRSTGFHAINAGSTVSGATYSTDTDYLKFSVYDDGSSSVSVNGSVTSGLSAGTNGGTKKILIGIGASLKFNGQLAEAIIYNSDQSASRAAIEANINSFYSIY